MDPRRGVVFLARTVVATTVTTVFAVLLGLASAAAAFVTASSSLRLPAGDGPAALGTVAFVIATGAAFAIGLGFLLRHTAGSLVTVFLLMLVLPIMLPQFGYAWMDAVAEVLPGSGAAFLLIGGVPGMTQVSSVTVLLGWAGAVLLLGWLRLTRDDANR